jgi:tRNA nucleotidyltransferase (CCA-adding enzyme)
MNPKRASKSLGAAIRRAYPELEAVREAAEEPVYLVGGAVRDLLLDRGRSDLDLVVVGDAATLAARLGAVVTKHERFATAEARLDGHRVDIASARTETYPRPGALPDVSAAADIEADLARRDFTVNAMALPLGGEPELIDPHAGRADLEAGLLRVLHERSFVDDPTRALRAARYAARFGFDIEPETRALLASADLETVSADRRRAELLRLAGDERPARGFALLAEWGLTKPRPGGLELVAATAALLEEPLWKPEVARASALLAAALGPAGAEAELAAARPARPSDAVALASARDGVELALARALGATWLDDYLRDWRRIGLEIGGADLIAAGVPEGPAVGRGLEAALRLKLDGEISGRAQELEAALSGARGADGVA